MRTRASTTGANALWTAEEVLALSDGQLLRGPRVGWHVTDVCVEPDRVTAGALVLTTDRERWNSSFRDTTDRIPELVAAGAAAIVIDDARRDLVLPADVPIIRVRNTRNTIDRLAAAARSRLRGKVVAVAGRGGAMATRCLGAVLEGPTSVNMLGRHGSAGVACALARTSPLIDHGVYEVRMRRAACLVRPDVMLVLTIPRHRSRRGAVKAADAFAEGFTGLRPNSTVVLNRDSRACHRLMLRAVEQGVGSILTFGTSHASDIRLVDRVVHNGWTRVHAAVLGEHVKYNVPSPRRRPVVATLAALAAAHAVGTDWRSAVRALDGLDGLERVVSTRRRSA